MSWSPNRKHITFTCPNGRKCRDSSLHDETVLKENLEALFLYRQATGFRPQTVEPHEGWMGELAAGWFQVAADLEHDDEWQLPAPPTWTDSKQRRREAIKKNGHGPEVQRWPTLGANHVTPVKSAPQKTIEESLAVQSASFVTLSFSMLQSGLPPSTSVLCCLPVAHKNLKGESP